MYNQITGSVWCVSYLSSPFKDGGERARLLGLSVWCSGGSWHETNAQHLQKPDAHLLPALPNRTYLKGKSLSAADGLWKPCTLARSRLLHLVLPCSVSRGLWQNPGQEAISSGTCVLTAKGPWHKPCLCQCVEVSLCSGALTRDQLEASA